MERCFEARIFGLVAILPLTDAPGYRFGHLDEEFVPQRPTDFKITPWFSRLIGI